MGLLPWADMKHAIYTYQTGSCYKLFYFLMDDDVAVLFVCSEQWPLLSRWLWCTAICIISIIILNCTKPNNNEESRRRGEKDCGLGCGSGKELLAFSIHATPSFCSISVGWLAAVTLWDCCPTLRTLLSQPIARQWLSFYLSNRARPPF